MFLTLHFFTSSLLYKMIDIRFKPHLILWIIIIIFRNHTKWVLILKSHWLLLQGILLSGPTWSWLMCNLDIMMSYSISVSADAGVQRALSWSRVVENWRHHRSNHIRCKVTLESCRHKVWRTTQFSANHHEPCWYLVSLPKGLCMHVWCCHRCVH